MSWIDIGALDDVPKRGARLIKTSKGCIAVFRTGDDQVFALNDSCPHKGGPLSEGIVHGTYVTCPLHNWVFSLETGRAQGADEGMVDTYPLRVESGRILLDGTGLAGRSAA
ncbi:MAG: nitrite reductase small subunit NirD [Brevirhabdus sp.]